MPPQPPTFGTVIPAIPKPPEITPKEQCKIDGGFWDEETQTCLKVKPEDKPKPPSKVVSPPGEITTIRDVEGKISGFERGGKEFLGALTPEEIAGVKAGEQRKFAPVPGVPERAGIRQQIQQQQEAQRLAGGIGQFGELPVSPTGLDVGEAAAAGIVGAIPRALGLAATGAAVGAVGGTAIAPGIGTAAGAAIGAAAGFVSGLASSMISNFKSQRTDTTTAQQRVLDEGKQTMKDWATLAKNDPANRAFYLAEYNKQSAQIDQAYRQMKLDTSRDLAKFETALPNLAEFESFYSAGGERDTLDIEMRNALIVPVTEGYDLFELADRRKNE